MKNMGSWQEKNSSRTCLHSDKPAPDDEEVPMFQEAGTSATALYS